MNVKGAKAMHVVEMMADERLDQGDCGARLVEYTGNARGIIFQQRVG